MRSRSILAFLSLFLPMRILCKKVLDDSQGTFLWSSFLKMAHIASSRERQPALMRDELEELLLGYIMRCVILAGAEDIRSDDLRKRWNALPAEMTPYHRPYVGDALTRHSRSGRGGLTRNRRTQSTVNT